MSRGERGSGLTSLFRALLGGVTLCVLGMASCSPASSSSPLPVSVSSSASSSPSVPLQLLRDDLGRQVRLSSAPTRIMSLLPSHTETLFALGLGSRVVAVDTHSDFPSAVSSLPKVGHVFQLQLEPILALKPELVLLSDDARAAESLERVGLLAWAGNPQSLGDVDRVTRTLGQLTGTQDKAEALLRELHQGLQAVSSEVQGLPRPRVYFELDPTPYAAGPSSFLGELLSLAGGDNIVPASLGSYPRLSPEFLLGADPELVLGPSLEELSARPSLSSLRAVRQGRVVSLSEAERSLLERPGPRLVEGLRLLVSKLSQFRTAPPEPGP